MLDVLETNPVIYVVEVFAEALARTVSSAI
jgi:hypothetical protein